METNLTPEDKMKRETDTGHQITARQLMEIILYDNGVVNANEPDTQSRYPIKYLDKITAACEVFFEAHPELLNDENLDLMCTGEVSEVESSFDKYPEFKQLSEALGDYFINL